MVLNNYIKTLLRFEWLGLFILITVLYFSRDYTVWLFVLLLLVPDISMIGYLKDSRLGALTYNIGHTILLPLTLLVVSLILNYEFALQLSLIWLAHITMDRAFGYGLKHTDDFKHTHLGWIGEK